MGTTLVSWLGRTDLRAVAESHQVGLGPVAQALQTGRFDRLELLCDYGQDEVACYLAWIHDQFEAPVTPHHITLDSPTDFGAIYRHARQVVADTVESQQEGDNLAFHLSPGTPAMAAVWIILAKTRFPAELIESSIPGGVRTASIPFDIAADFLPDLLNHPDRELERLTAGLPPAAPEFSAIIHQSPAMQRAIARARRAAPRSIPVLIEGESGTGKELLARAIHQASPRRNRSFVTVNCGAIAPDLVESELFGHEKGAFTGAAARRAGYFEAAHTGTLFLDEIGELPKPAQVKLLRALQEGEVIRVGATSATSVDVRILAATNRTLVEEVAGGRFREDLFYRLAVAVIRLPPLREREGDTGLLLDRLLDQVNCESETEPGYTPKKLSVGARRLLIEHPWPGNVREMQNTLRRAAVWTPGPVVDTEDARDALLPRPRSKEGIEQDPILGQDIVQGVDLKAIIDRVERHYLERAIEVTAGNKSRAATLLGLGNATTLTNWLKKHGVQT
ncbi:sigma-54-dependent transcriptional regulator [Thiocapsa rosea]|uniref:Regulatory Fis family protein n=1 Tax=Thiocapsa rosea TaxID=69360 RepID=A0A495VDG4_9GAMM|nr:sigma-54 dependent transcriptional regulator [Thiocapsa rosea]RKT46653.1 regulatory Fis family protein [Thiocapsa rosea]